MTRIERNRLGRFASRSKNTGFIAAMKSCKVKSIVELAPATVDDE